MKTQIIRKEDYDSDRLSSAVKSAVMANHSLSGQADDFAARVIHKVESWLGDKTEFTARELRLQTAAALADYDPDAAYFYENEKRMF